MMLKLTLEALFAPASLIGLLLTVALIWTFLRCRRAVPLIVLTLVWLLYGVTTSPFIADMAIGRLQDIARRDATCPPPPPGATLVVLAGGIDDDTSDVEDFNALQSQSIRRLLAALRLGNQTPGSTLLLSGGSGDPLKEADVMRAMAIQFGFPAGRIIIDTRSQTTYQSAANLSHFIPPGAKKPIYLITSAYHMPRAFQAFRAFRPDICAWPVDFTHHDRPYPLRFLPSARAMERTYRALHEFVGIAFYSVVKIH